MLHFKLSIIAGSSITISIHFLQLYTLHKYIVQHLISLRILAREEDFRVGTKTDTCITVFLQKKKSAFLRILHRNVYMQDFYHSQQMHPRLQKKKRLLMMKKNVFSRAFCFFKKNIGFFVTSHTTVRFAVVTRQRFVLLCIWM